MTFLEWSEGYKIDEVTLHCEDSGFRFVGFHSDMPVIALAL